MIDQTSQFFAILTNVGAAKQANADALGIPWTITHMGVGDANGTDPIPSATQTALINERRRAPLNQLKVDPANNAVIIAEQVIPEDVGGWWIREIGLYDLDGDLVAIANCAPSFKPLLTQGSGRTQVVRMNMIVSNSSNVQLKIDPSVVLATRAYVDGLTVRANQAEAEAGTESSKIMTPLRVFQAIAKVVKQATESAFGWAKISTQAQVTTGTDDTTIITPKKLRAAQATRAEAEAGTDDSKVMTPLRVFEAIGKYGGITSINANTNLTAANRGLVLIDAVGGARTITLPPANAALGVVDLFLRRIDITINALVIAADGTDKIMLDTTAQTSGLASTELLFAGDFLHLRSDGEGKWWCLGQAQLPGSLDSGLVVFTAAGVTSFTVPPILRSGRRVPLVTAIGAGGGGGRSSSAGVGSGGGGGGGVGKVRCNLSGVSSVSVTVGAKGLGATTAGTAGGIGGTSSFGTFVSATGGLGGGGNASSVNTGGDTGLGSGGSIHSGLGTGTSNFGGEGGTGGGPGFRAGQIAGPGSNAALSGGGGSGARSGENGGSGANGEVVIQW